MKLQSIAWIVLALFVGLFLGGWALRTFMHTVHLLTALAFRVAVLVLVVAVVAHLVKGRA